MHWCLGRPARTPDNRTVPPSTPITWFVRYAHPAVARVTASTWWITTSKEIEHGARCPTIRFTGPARRPRILRTVSAARAPVQPLVGRHRENAPAQPTLPVHHQH